MKELVSEDDPILKKRAVAFNFDNPQEDPKKLKEELFEAMVKYDGLGLSACQIGIDLKVFVIRIDNDGIVYIGKDTNITAGTGDATDGIPLTGGDSIFLPLENPNLVYILADVADQKIYWVAL